MRTFLDLYTYLSRNQNEASEFKDFTERVFVLTKGLAASDADYLTLIAGGSRSPEVEEILPEIRQWGVLFKALAFLALAGKRNVSGAPSLNIFPLLTYQLCIVYDWRALCFMPAQDMRDDEASSLLDLAWQGMTGEAKRGWTKTAEEVTKARADAMTSPSVGLLTCYRIFLTQAMRVDPFYYDCLVSTGLAPSAGQIVKEELRLFPYVPPKQVTVGIVNDILAYYHAAFMRTRGPEKGAKAFDTFFGEFVKQDWDTTVDYTLRDGSPAIDLRNLSDEPFSSHEEFYDVLQYSMKSGKLDRAVGDVRNY